MRNSSSSSSADSSSAWRCRRRLWPMKSLDALRLNQLHSMLKKPRPFSERGAISIGTWFLWVTLICRGRDKKTRRIYIRYNIRIEYKIFNLELTVQGICIQGSPSICMGNVFLVLMMTSLHCAKRRPEARSPVRTCPMCRQFSRPMTSMRRSPKSKLNFNSISD